VCLDSLTPATGQLNEWQPCDVPYSRSGSSGPGGCGGCSKMCFSMRPSRPNRRDSGATETRADDFLHHALPTLPITLQPGERLTTRSGLGRLRRPVVSDWLPHDGCPSDTGDLHLAFRSQLMPVRQCSRCGHRQPLTPATEGPAKACTGTRDAGADSPATTPATGMCPVPGRGIWERQRRALVRNGYVDASVDACRDESPARR
jgi:hypothetical protein